MGGESMRKYKESSIFWKINARHKMAGRKHIVTQEEVDRRSHAGSGRPSIMESERAGARRCELPLCCEPWLGGRHVLGKRETTYAQPLQQREARRHVVQ